METVAVLPIKTFARAKHRLAEAVDGDDRRELAEAMVGDVFDALGAVPELSGVIAVTAEPRAAAIAREAGAEVVHDPAETGQSPAAVLGVEAAMRRGAPRALLVPGDCPALDPDEVSALLTFESPVVIVADRHGAGTNALLLSPPDAIQPSFGPGSFARHAARGRGVGVAVAEVPSLGLDVDTPGDLAALRAALMIRRGRAERTRALLERLMPAPA
jgi:2-phospho-L-lactate/phosphoenolpyruvate guanylyltransferase